MSLFYNMNESQRVEKITMKWPADGYVIPAGTPVSATGVANNGDAIGILASEARVRYPYPLSIAEKVGKKEPKGNLDYTFSVITGGFVNRKEAETAFGDTYSDDAISAMTDISFINPQSAKFGGGVTSWNELTDKPFGEEVTSVKISEKELTFQDEDGMYMSTLGYGQPLGDNDVIHAGVDAVVTFDGVEYKCKTKYHEDGFAFIGDIQIVYGEATEGAEPFVIMFFDRAFATVFTLQVGDTHTVGLTFAKLTVTAIDERFIPETVVMKNDITSDIVLVTFTRDASGVYSCDKTVREISALFSTGKCVIGVIPTETTNSMYYRIPCVFCNGVDANFCGYVSTSYGDRDLVDLYYSSSGIIVVRKGFLENVTITKSNYITLYSSESDKKFKITVDDSGTLSATAI